MLPADASTIDMPTTTVLTAAPRHPRFGIVVTPTRLHSRPRHLYLRLNARGNLATLVISKLAIICLVSYDRSLCFATLLAYRRLIWFIICFTSDVSSLVLSSNLFTSFPVSCRCQLVVIPTVVVLFASSPVKVKLSWGSPAVQDLYIL